LGPTKKEAVKENKYKKKKEELGGT